MFPLVPVPPTCREAWIVCMADKWCALYETVAARLPGKGASVSASRRVRTRTGVDADSVTGE